MTINKRHIIISAAVLCVLTISAFAVLPHLQSPESKVSEPDVQTVAVSAQDESSLRKFILEHEQLRNLQLSELDEIVNSENSSREISESAQKAKMELLEQIESESTVSGILQARGYKDAAVSAGKDHINVMVSALQASEGDIARIMELIISQTEISADNIKIIPIN